MVNEEIYRKYYRKLVYFAANIVGEEDAHDIVIDVMMKDFRHEGNIKQFLYASVRNACINMLRLRNRHNEDHKYLYNQLETDTYIVQAEVLEGMYMQLLKDVVDKAYSLSTMCGLVIIGCFEGMTISEIAKDLKIDVRTALNHKTRGIGIMREHFAHMREDEDIILHL